ALGFDFGNRGLAQRIDGEGERAPAQTGNGLERFGDVGAGDETSGQALGIVVRRARQQTASKTVTRQVTQAEAQPGRQMGSGFGEVFAQVRSEERRVGKECRLWWAAVHL